MPEKHVNYTRKVFDGIGEGGWVGGDVKAITRTASAVKNQKINRSTYSSTSNVMSEIQN
jgi:hypothetical protein